jgi:hypothetical protein
METIPIVWNVIFIVTTLLTVWQFYKATNQSKVFLSTVLVIATVQLVLGLTNFYENENTTPPRFVLLIAPAVLIVVFLFVFPKARNFLATVDMKKLAILHVVRIPVEIVLYVLFLKKTIPITMTFEGRNLDIIAGITAPIIFYWGFVKGKIPKWVIIVWNIFCLALLINIIVIAILSAKTPFQQFGFEQPNIAIAYFPFTWLPSIIVLLVLMAHLSTLWQLWLARKKG